MNRLLIIYIVLVFLCFPCLAIADILLERDNSGPIKVSSDKLFLDDVSGVLLFTGNAVASQDGLEISGDKLIVTYKGESRDIEKVVAEGNVKIIQNDRTASGQKAFFFREEGRIVLTGNPKVSQGDNYVQGETITIFLNDQRSIVSGGTGGRVNAVFTPKAEGKP